MAASAGVARGAAMLEALPMSANARVGFDPAPLAAGDLVRLRIDFGNAEHRQHGILDEFEVYLSPDGGAEFPIRLTGEIHVLGSAGETATELVIRLPSWVNEGARLLVRGGGPDPASKEGRFERDLAVSSPLRIGSSASGTVSDPPLETNGPVADMGLLMRRFGKERVEWRVGHAAKELRRRLRASPPLRESSLQGPAVTSHGPRGLATYAPLGERDRWDSRNPEKATTEPEGRPQPLPAFLALAIPYKGAPTPLRN